MTVVATAGHVDHGKSTLVEALTGVDPDRWSLEKERGMTIDLGFATTTLPSGRVAEFVDVPGHSRYLDNMLAGVATAGAALFVVAAPEGWKAQSEEHLRILSLFGHTAGLIALTKVGLVDAETREIAELEIRDQVAGTFLERAEIVPVDVPGRVGINEIRAALDRLLSRVPDPPDGGRPRLWVDRAFAIRGAGCVVTGTLTGGSLSQGDELVVEPGHHPVRVKGLQGNHAQLASIGPGRRVAVNLTGISHHEVSRGQALVRPGRWHLASRFDASVGVLTAAGFDLSHRGAFVVSLGTGDHPVRLRVLGGGSISPGGEGALRIAFTGGTRLPLLPGDRYVLRELGRKVLVGGGEVLDVDPRLPLRRAAPDRSVDRVVAERGWVDAAHLERLTGQRVAPNVGGWVMAEAVRRSVVDRLVAMAADAGAAGAPIAGLAEHERAVLEAGVDGLAVRDGRVLRTEHAPDVLRDDERRVLAVLESAPFTPPELPLADRGTLRSLERRKLAFESDGVWFPALAMTDAARILGSLLDLTPEGITVSEIRQALGTSRKYALPLVHYLDGCGVTRRQGDNRVAGRQLEAYRKGPAQP